MTKENILEKCQSIFMTLVIVCLVAAGFVGTTLAETDEASQTNIEANIEQTGAKDLVSVSSVPSTDTFTGCLSTTSKLYYVQAGTEPGGTCQSGDKTVSFVNTSYINTLETRLAKLEKLLTNVSRSGNNIYFNKVNVHIRDGSGSTDGPVNGLGNLIIGYNEKRGSDDDRTGSHNLILGLNNNYKSYGGLVAGFWNEISGAYASVSGGYLNTASGMSSSVSGGANNKATYNYASVSGTQPAAFPLRSAEERVYQQLLNMHGQRLTAMAVLIE